MSGKIIIARLKHAGVEFIRRDGQPTRFHSQNHGELRDTFLCTDDCFSVVEWRWNGYRGMEIAKEPECSTAKMARGVIYASHNDEFSGYGKGLWLATTPLPKENYQRDLFVMEAPTREQLREWRQ